MPPIDPRNLFHEVMRARQRVYRLARPTPLEALSLPDGTGFWLKREDLSPIHSYKWRGAYNRMCLLDAAERERGVVAASAGNHAQGVALSARRLGCRARLFMPRSTPRMKLAEVRRLGGDAVETILHGDNYDEVAARALQDAAESGATFIPPYDDLHVMAGQGTLGDEIVQAAIDPDVAFLQIGGGGMAAATACVLKTFYPEILIIGVEGEGQASMARAVEAGHPVEIEDLDIFCDGTAVRRAGKRTHPLCAELIDEFITVSNDEVCAAIEQLWEAARLVPEPSGAMGVAALMQRRATLGERRCVCVLSGANIDFTKLAWVARHAGVGLARRRYYQFEIDEAAGSLLDVLETYLDGLDIVDFQYGKVDERKAWPVIGVEASPPALEALDRRLAEAPLTARDVTSREDVEFRMIHYRSRLFRNPYFAIIEFPERAGALYDFLRDAGGLANICYFNYAESGEEIGRAMMGFEFESNARRGEFLSFLEQRGPRHREISADVLRAIL